MKLCRRQQRAFSNMHIHVGARMDRRKCHRCFRLHCTALMLLTAVTLASTTHAHNTSAAVAVCPAAKWRVGRAARMAHGILATKHAAKTCMSPQAACATAAVQQAHLIQKGPCTGWPTDSAMGYTCCCHRGSTVSDNSQTQVMYAGIVV